MKKNEEAAEELREDNAVFNNDNSLVESKIDNNESESSIDSFKTVDKRFNTINFIYTNARSLPPKINHLIQVFDSFNLHFAAISETWMCDSTRYKRNAEKLEHKENLCIIKKSRKSRGGGVAIVFNKSKISLKQIKIPGNAFELVGAVGRTTDDVQKVLVLSVYYPPQMKREEVDRLNECISTTIDNQKGLYPGLQVVLCGDMNNKDVVPILTDHPDLKVLDTPSTGKRETLDLCLNNLSGDIAYQKIQPLSTESGQVSDHDCIFVKSIAERKHIFEKIKFKFRPFTKEGADKFGACLALVDWAPIHVLDVNQAVKYMGEVLELIYRDCFPEKEKTVKSSDPLWFNRRVKRATERKRKYFRKHGKNDHRLRLQEEPDITVNQAKKDLEEKVKKDVAQSKNMCAFFRVVKMLNAKEVQPQWDIRKLFPGMTDVDIANECVDYFSSISREYDPIPKPVRNGTSDWTIELHEISNWLKHCNKPKGMVEGDILPDLVTRFHDLIAIPLHHIFNQVVMDCEWPELWKTETVKIIPKGNIPESIKDVRNISCTPLFSKVLEHFVLVKLRSCMALPNSQFGGLKGVSIDPFLAETWHEVLMDLEDPCADSSLITIDFSKAFNRMDHAACLGALREAGVPENVV